MTICEEPVSVQLSELIAPSFFSVHRDIREGGHLHYWLSGGRGSCKSSFASLEIVLGVMRHPDANAVCFRKVKATLRDSVFSQLLWAIDKLGVSDRWRSSVSPLSLRYLPTGQMILFRGLDRAKKSKSLKAPKGYFRYLWFEELEEFSSPEELRTVCQSILRGGEQFCCLYTYNPPKSRRSWVNVEAATPKEGRLLHKSDYRTVPRSWLGEEFFLEAGRLSKENPKAWRHEYLGECGDREREVFANLTLRPISEGEIAAFDRIVRGLDFGYAADPLHYTAFQFETARKRLLIFFEIHRRRLSNGELAELILAEQKNNGAGPVCCDSAEPKSIDDLYLSGVRTYPATKGPGSVARGLRFLSEEVSEIVIDPTRCPNTAREFSTYEYTEKEDGYPDRDNHSIDAVRYALERYIGGCYKQQKEDAF